MRLFWRESLDDYAALIAPTIRVGRATHRIFAWCLFCLSHHLGNNAIQHIEVAKLNHHFALIFGADFDRDLRAEGVGQAFLQVQDVAGDDAHFGGFVALAFE